MSEQIKAIETLYDGYRFRSRLEARWAVFFNSLGIKYQYEPEGYVLSNNVCYLPDFYLPESNRWVEIKGKPLSDLDIKKCEQFCEDQDDKGIKFSIFIGTPELYSDNKNKMFGIKGFSYEWMRSTFMCNDTSEIKDPFKNISFLIPDGFSEHPILSRFIPTLWCDLNFSINDYVKACSAAKQARFEHGETPEVQK